jgi:hypothetical protein
MRTHCWRPNELEKRKYTYEGEHVEGNKVGLSVVSSLSG